MHEPRTPWSLSFPNVHLNDLFLILPAMHSHGHSAASVITSEISEESTHPLVTGSSLSSESTLDFPCLLLGSSASSDACVLGHFSRAAHCRPDSSPPPHWDCPCQGCQGPSKCHILVLAASYLSLLDSAQASPPARSLWRHFLCLPRACWASL